MISAQVIFLINFFVAIASFIGVYFFFPEQIFAYLLAATFSLATILNYAMLTKSLLYKQQAQTFILFNLKLLLLGIFFFTLFNLAVEQAVFVSLSAVLLIFTSVTLLAFCKKKTT